MFTEVKTEMITFLSSCRQHCSWSCHWGYWQQTRRLFVLTNTYQSVFWNQCSNSLKLRVLNKVKYLLYRDETVFLQERKSNCRIKTPIQQPPPPQSRFQNTWTFYILQIKLLGGRKMSRAPLWCQTLHKRSTQRLKTSNLSTCLFSCASMHPILVCTVLTQI